ncbi:MAG TPA: aminotransferase class V-fold PLP-dependent enzyme [Candidatus Binatia bacterium]|nr:aminotransferase class V-fold PLP-dependent enzyme [Candidatus Binatia bacterium]
MWTQETYREIVRVICSGQVIDGNALEELESIISEALAVRSVLLCGSGSFALELALSAGGVQPGDEIVIPTFCCSAIVPPILSIGATPVLADIGEELNITRETVAAVLTKKTRAVIVPHLFGNPADIQDILELAQRRNFFVIDDAAQAFGATIGKRPVGSFGNFGILSFGDEKLCPSIGGGALVSRENDIFVAKSAMPLRSASYVTTLRRCFSTLIWNCSRHWFAPLTKLRGSHSDPTVIPACYGREAMPNLYAAVAVTLVERLAEHIAARRERVRAYQQLLGHNDSLELIPHRLGSACVTQVVRVLPRKRSRDIAMDVVNALAAEKYAIRGSYVPLHLIPGLSACVWDRLPHADRIWSDLIELPCEPSVGFDDVTQIATIVAAVASS